MARNRSPQASMYRFIAAMLQSNCQRNHLTADEVREGEAALSAFDAEKARHNQWKAIDRKRKAGWSQAAIDQWMREPPKVRKPKTKKVEALVDQPPRIPSLPEGLRATHVPANTITSEMARDASSITEAMRPKTSFKSNRLANLAAETRRLEADISGMTGGRDSNPGQ